MDDYLGQGYADALKEFPALAVHEGTPDFEPVLWLAVRLVDGIEDEIDSDLWEITDWAAWTEYMNRAGWIEDEHGSAVFVPYDEDGQPDEGER
jgi:hypothetical protein